MGSLESGDKGCGGERREGGIRDKGIRNRNNKRGEKGGERVKQKSLLFLLCIVEPETCSRKGNTEAHTNLSLYYLKLYKVFSPFLSLPLSPSFSE
jgi:hypothetical protein